MKSNPIFRFSCSALLSGWATCAQAATLYWDGASSSWNTASNWTTDAGATTPDPVSPPGALDDANFNRTGQNGNITIGLNADPSAQSLTFSSAGSTTIRGNDSGTTVRQLTLGTGGITVNSGAGAANIGTTNNGVINIVLSGAQTWTNNSSNPLSIGTGYNSSATSANVDLGANQLTIDGSGRINVGVVNQAEAVLTGSGALIKNGTGLFSLGSNNSAGFSGNVTVNNGILYYGDSPAALGTGNLLITGGAIEGRWNNAFNRTQGTGAGQIQITGGISGFGGGNNSPYNIGAITWGSATFNPTEFILQTSNAASNGRSTLSSNINLSGADRTIRSDQVATDLANGWGNFSGNITNTGATAGLIKTGIGHHILSGTNTYDGGTTINQGALTFQKIAAMPSAGTVQVNNGTVLGIRVGGAGNWTNGTSGVGTLGGLFAGDGGQTAAQVNYTGNVGVLLDMAANTTYSGDIANVGTTLALYKAGASSLTLTGNNSYTGGTTLSAGALIVGSNTAIPNTGTIFFNGGGIQSSDATARTFSNPIAFGGDVTIGGTGNITFSDTGAVALGANRTITVSTSGVNATFAQSFSGSGFGITKAGAGSLTLTGDSTYTGTTTINGGEVLLYDGTIAGSRVTFGGNNTSLTITGGTGITSTWNVGNQEFGTANSTYNNVQVVIDGDGVEGSALVTNVGTLVWGKTAISSTLLLTNGGQMNVNGEVRIGNPYYNTGGGANLTIQGGTATSTLSGDGQDDFYIGYGERENSNNNVVTVGSGGVLTQIRDTFVGHVNNQQGNDLASTANKLTISGTGTASLRGLSVGYAQNAGAPPTHPVEKANANVVEVISGGQLSTTGTGYIGRANAASTESDANTITVSGPGSTWNAGGQTVYVGHANNATAQSNNNILTVGDGGALSSVNNLFVGFGTGTAVGNQVVLNGGSITANTITVNAGNSLLIGTGGGSLAGDITNNGALDINSAAPVSISGNISGSGGLTHTGAGTTTLAGGSSYMGDTTVSGGTLLVEGYTEATGLVNVSSGATVGGSGQIGIVTVTDGFFAPGGVADNTLDVNSLTLNPAATLVVGLDDPSLPVWNDLIQIASSLTLAGQINVVPQPGAPGYDFLTATPGTQWLVATYTPGNLVNAGAVTIASAPALAPGLAWALDTATTDGSVFLTVVVPEPAAASLMAAGLLVLFLRRHGR